MSADVGLTKPGVAAGDKGDAAGTPPAKNAREGQSDTGHVRMLLTDESQHVHCKGDFILMYPLDVLHR